MYILTFCLLMCSWRTLDHSNVWMLEKVTMVESLSLCTRVTTWVVIRYTNSIVWLLYGKRVGFFSCWCWCVSFQYFEYTSHNELRHNIGKQLCLHASQYPEQVKIELCILKGKGSSLAPEQEWVFTEVSVLENWTDINVWIMFCFFPSIFLYTSPYWFILCITL